MGKSGTFVRNNETTIHVWEKPDKNGDGPRHSVQKQNEDSSFSWEDATDSDGTEVFRYNPPENFKNVPSRNELGQESENFVLHDDRNQVRRDRNGNALSIVPGGLAVEHPDGTFESVPPEKAKKFLSDYKEG